MASLLAEAMVAPLQQSRCLGFSRLPRISSLQLKRLSRSFSMTDSQVASRENVEEEKAWKQFFDHQKGAKKLTYLEEARTLLDLKRSGVLSTISQTYDGFPYGSMVDFGSDLEGRPVLAISTLSPHTNDLISNPKCSLLVPKDPANKSDTIITIVGEATMVPREEVRDEYLKKHPNAFWVDFGDFKFARIEPKKVRFVTGLVTGQAAVADLDGAEFKAAAVDPIAQFSVPIVTHMNKDHAEDVKVIVEHAVRLKVESATMLDLDRFGFNAKSTLKGSPLKIRVPFPRTAEDRKDVKTLIIEMLNSARAGL